MKRTIVTGVMLLASLLNVSPTFAQATIEYYHLDAIGSVRAVTDAQGVVVRRHDYFPFGEEYLTQQGRDPIRFAGKSRDKETGLDYFNARYYASRAGRFTSADPSHINGNTSDPQSWNAYAYARNNPLRFVDPTGMEYEICAWGGGCGSVSDQYFGQLERNPGAGITLWGGWILATVNGVQQVAGFYRQTSVDSTFGSFIAHTGDRADAVENLLKRYEEALAQGGRKLANDQPRRDLMKRILELW